MNRYYPIIQGYVWIARLSGSVVTASAAPAANSEHWLKLGEAVNGSLTPDIETKTRTRIVLGRREQVEEVIRETYTMKTTIEELNKLVVDLVFGSNTTATNDFIATGNQGRRAWVRFQGYEQTDANRVLLQGLVMIKPSGDTPLFGEEFFKADFDMKFEGRPTGQLIGAYGS